MPIKKRPVKLAVENEEKFRGRHPKLKLGSDRYMIWQYIKGKPGATRPEIRDDLGLEHGPAMARVTELLNEGLVEETGEVRTDPHSGRPAKCLQVVPENATGVPRDQLSVEITVLRNDDGEYSIDAKLLGQLPFAHESNPRPVMRKTVKLRPPKRGEPVDPSVARDPKVIDADMWLEVQEDVPPTTED